MKITAKDFSTNRDMLRKDVLRYVETFITYCNHIKEYYDEDLNEVELRWLLFISQRIELFLQSAPKSDKYACIVGRYTRCLTKLNKLKNETGK